MAMKKRSLILTLTIALVLLTSSTAQLADTHSDDQEKDQPMQVIRLVERIVDFTIQDFGAPGPSLGDRLIFTSDLFDEAGNRIGRDGADCVVVRLDPEAPLPEQQVVQCTITVALADGQLTFQGLAQGTENLFALTGGTGAYRKARGEALAKDRVPLQVADVTITLFR
jgi:hypothetical protein